MSTQLIKQDKAVEIERVLVGGDLGKLSPEDRVTYYKMVCDSVGLNPLTRPFEYITLNGKLTLYARKDCTDQLRNVHQVIVNIVARESVEGCYIVTSRAKLPSGREDESIGAVPIENLKGEARANAMMKCETKAKRRVTLSICGLGILDETEVETIPSAKPPVERTTEEIPLDKPKSAAPSNGKGGVQGGLQPPAAADKDSTAERTADTDSLRSAEPEMRPSIETAGGSAAAVEYISKEEAANFHRECKKAIPERVKLKQPDLEYTWLYDNGYLNADGEPTAEKIKKSEWPAARNMCCAWLRAQ